MTREQTHRAEGIQAEIPAPAKLVSTFLERPPEPTKNQLANLNEPIRRRPRVPLVPEPDVEPEIAAPESATETVIKQNKLPAPLRNAVQTPHDVKIQAARPPRTLVSFLGTAVLPKGQPGLGSTVNEPSVAHGGKHVLYSGNWYLARSSDGGLNWSFIDPLADMKDFCCDQDVIYDRGRDLFLWYRQGVRDSTGKGRAVLGASTDGGATWYTYSISPSILNASWNKDQAFDFPQLALSDNFLYIHTGINGTGVPQTVVLRFPLDALASRSAFSFWWWGQVSYWGTPVQGATTAMYFGDHRGSRTSFRIYRQLESDAGITAHDVSIPGWLLEQGGVCPAKDGNNWCVRSDSVVRAGWVANDQLGFLWHARAGNGFPYPYIEAATFREDDFSYVGRPLIWSESGAWHYPFASPNARGDVAVTAFYSTPTSFPSPCLLLDDDYSGTPPPWEAYRLFSGSASAVWGDYVRNRAFQPSQLGWVTSGWVAEASREGTQAVPLYYILARQRDLPSVGKYWQA